jgi:hypothetical protein
MLQSAFKRRMGIDTLSERSAMIGEAANNEMKKYKYEVLLERLDRFKT